MVWRERRPGLADDQVGFPNSVEGEARPVDREALLKREDDAWLTFADIVGAMPPDRREAQGVVPGWSTHDLVWHCAYWAGYAGEMLERIRAGEQDPDDSDLPEDEILAAGRGMKWEEVILRAQQGRERVRTALLGFEDLPQPAIEWFQDDTFDHYEEHGAQIRAFGA